jgi:hypothetical protein
MVLTGAGSRKSYWKAWKEAIRDVNLINSDPMNCKLMGAPDFTRLRFDRVNCM